MWRLTSGSSNKGLAKGMMSRRQNDNRHSNAKKNRPHTSKFETSPPDDCFNLHIATPKPQQAREQNNNQRPKQRKQQPKQQQQQ